MQKAHAHPYIQTHTFSIEPYLHYTQGYAPFVASSQFDGTERVKFQSLDDHLLPSTEKTELLLNEFTDGKWFLSAAARFFMMFIMNLTLSNLFKLLLTKLKFKLKCSGRNPRMPTIFGFSWFLPIQRNFLKTCCH